MNPAFFGDSYDLVKRFFCVEISSLGYSIAINPMFTGDWSGTENAFYRLLGAEPNGKVLSDAKPRALFLAPDTGVKQKGSKQHVSFARLAQETKKFQLVFSFDQSFSRQANPATVIREKLAELRALAAVPCSTIPMLAFFSRLQKGIRSVNYAHTFSHLDCQAVGSSKAAPNHSIEQALSDLHFRHPLIDLLFSPASMLHLNLLEAKPRRVDSALAAQ